MNSDIAFDVFMRKAATQKQTILKEAGIGVQDASKVIQRLTSQNAQLRKELTDLKSVVPTGVGRPVDVTKRELLNQIKSLKQQVQLLSEELVETQMDLTALRMMKRKAA